VSRVCISSNNKSKMRGCRLRSYFTRVEYQHQRVISSFDRVMDSLQIMHFHQHSALIAGHWYMGASSPIRTAFSDIMISRVYLPADKRREYVVGVVLHFGFAQCKTRGHITSFHVAMEESGGMNEKDDLLRSVGGASDCKLWTMKYSRWSTSWQAADREP
jgi:hypothetical protein